MVAGDLMHHMIQCREPEWSAKPDWDPKQSAISRRKFFASVAGTDTLILPIHFPTPTAGLITADGDRFNYRFKRDYRRCSTTPPADYIINGGGAPVCAWSRAG